MRASTSARRAVAVSVWKARLYRWRWWILAVAVVIAVRAALPEILRRVLISQASEALKARVEVGDVDLFLLHGDVALENVSVREAAASPTPSARREAVARAYAAEAAPGEESRSPSVTPPSPARALPSPSGAIPPGEAAAPSPSPTWTAEPTATAVSAAGTPLSGGTGVVGEESPPIIAFERLAVSLHYLPLLWRTVRLREIVLDSPRVDLKRLSSGSFNLLALLPAPEKTAARQSPTPAPSPTPAAAEEGTGWHFGIDRFTLRGGKVRFRDLMLRGSEPVEVNVGQIGFEDVELTPGLYGEPGRAHIEMSVGGGRLTLDAEVDLLKKGIALGCNLKANDLPVRQGRLYVPGVGWSGLQGKLDLNLTYDLQTEAKNRLSGTAALREFAVQVPFLERPALSWRRLGVQIDSLDLLADRVDVASVELDGAALAVRASGGILFPLLATKLQQAAAATPEAHASPGGETPSPTPGSEGTPGAAPAAGGAGPGPAATEPPAAAASGTPPAATPREHSARRLAGVAEAQEIPTAPPPSAAATAASAPTAAAAETPTNATAESASAAPTPTPETGPQPAQQPAAPESGAAGAPASAPQGKGPFHWSLASLRITDSTVHVLDPHGPLDLGVGVQLDDLAGSGDRPGHVKMDLALQQGALRIDGDVRVAPPGFGGELTLDSLALPPVVVLRGLLPAEALQSATLGGALTIEAGLPVQGQPAPAAGEVQVAGKLGLTGLELAPPGMKDLEVGADSIDVQLSEVAVPGAMPGGEGTAIGPVSAAGEIRLSKPRVALADGKQFSVSAKSIVVPISRLSLPVGPGAPLQVALGKVSLVSPKIRLTRTEQGLVLPGPSAAETKPQPAPPATPATGEAASAPPGIDVKVDSLRVERGKVEVTDDAVKPTFSTRLYPVDVRADDLRWPNPGAKPIRLSVTTPDQGTVVVTGQLASDTGKFEIDVKKLGLGAFAPYVATYSPYSSLEGALSLETKLSMSAGKYDTDNSITLHDFDLRGAAGESGFQQRFGIPLEMALALMRDQNGDIALDVPVAVGPEHTSVDFGSIILSALRTAVKGAITSPLKLLGAVTGSGKGKIKSISPAPIGFVAGQADLTAEGAQGAQRLAQFLQSRPALAVELSAPVTPEDVRRLREQALLDELGKQGFFKSVLSFAGLSKRDRIRRALEARAQGEPGELSPEDEQVLQQWLAERPGPSPQALKDLGQRRLAAVEEALRGDANVGPKQIVLDEPTAEVAEGKPEVQIGFLPVEAES
jgi:uncharacterized protein involved in outer membrane biogenesis